MAGKLKYRWSVSNNGLTGIPVEQWWKLLRENQFAVEPAYYHRFAFITLLSLINSLNRRREERIFGTAVETVELVEPPIFIVGHFRSGTTHLHNLLAADAAQFGCPNTYQTAHPYSFLSSEKLQSRMLAPFLSKTRPMDNMALSLQTPQEHEYALGLASFCSPFLSYSFPKRYDWYLRFLTFNDATVAEKRRWQAALVWFVRKLTLKYGRRLVLKSPPDTARLKLILETFPGACFVHIYRDPYTVYQSTRHLYDIVPWHMCFQRPDAAYTDDRIVEQYTAMYDNYFRDKEAVPAGQLHEVRFEALEQDPVGEVASIYETFNLSGFGRTKPKLERYLDSITDYRKNGYPEMPEPLRSRLAREWQRSFEAWEYPV